MATRATIKIEGVNFTKVYKHWDGYPDATLEWLEAFNKEFTEARGDDPTYKIAQLLRSSIFYEERFNLDPSKTTGWGIIEYTADYGEEYEYELEKNGKVTYKEIY